MAKSTTAQQTKYNQRALVKRWLLANARPSIIDELLDVVDDISDRNMLIEVRKAL